MYTSSTFFQKFSKPFKFIIQNTEGQRHVSTPHILFAKIAKNPDGRTDERTFQF